MGNIFWSLDEGLLTFLGPYPLPSFPALGTLTFEVIQAKVSLPTVTLLHSLPVLELLSLQSPMN